MNVSQDLVIKDIDNILTDSCFDDKELAGDIITNLEKTAVEQIKLGKVIKIPYIGNYAYNKVYLNLKEHHKELKEYRKTVDIGTYRKTVKELVNDTKKKVAEETKSELHWNKFKTKNKKKFYEIAQIHGINYAKVWLILKSTVSIVEFDKDVQYMYDMLNEKS